MLGEMKVLLACEFTQIVTEAFAMQGHEVLSCWYVPRSSQQKNNKMERRICQHCGAKRNLNQLEAVGSKPGQYFQAYKEVTLYVCRQMRRKHTGGMFLYCNLERTPPEIKYIRHFKPIKPGSSPP